MYNLIKHAVNADMHKNKLAISFQLKQIHLVTFWSTKLKYYNTINLHYVFVC